MTDGADLGLTRLREQHTRDKAITSICGECGWPFPCATVRLLDRMAALEEALALTPHGFTGGLEERIPWFIHCGISHGADRPDCLVCRLLSGAAPAAGEE